MNKQRLNVIIRLGLAILCFVMAVISFLGVGTTDERHGRLIFGFMWICVGVLCVIRYLMEKHRDPSGDDPGSLR